MWSIFDAQPIIKQLTFRHMRFSGGNTYVFVVEKVHFQKNTIFAMSKWKMCRGTTSRCAEKHRPQDPSENHHFGTESRDVFENVRGAADISNFRSPHIGNSCLFWTRESILDWPLRGGPGRDRRGASLMAHMNALIAFPIPQSIQWTDSSIRL